MILNQGAHYFFCGIGGSGMLPLALILKGQGYQVEGSDRALDQGRLAEKFDYLRAQGIALHPQDGSGIRSANQILVTSAAVEDTIPDVRAARQLGLTIARRAELLAEIFNASRVSVAIGGTSGKSTTTGMAGWIFEVAGRQPTIMNGAVMKDFAKGNHTYASSVVGRGDVFISEVDESDGSISLYRPTVATVTNVSLDHKPLEELRKLFGDFVSHADVAVLNLDNPDAAALATRAQSSLSFSVRHPDADLFATDITPLRDGSTFQIRHHQSGQRLTCRINLPGRHNIANALAALASAIAAGIPLADGVGALASFTGIRRRFDIVGTVNDITVIDDFAHNPDKIAATYHTLHEFPGRVITMFQPHGFGPLKLMGHELIASFAREMEPDDIVIMPDPAYYGGTTTRVVGSSDIVNGIARLGRTAIYEEHRADCLARIEQVARPGDRVVIMGARDDTLSEFARQLLERLSRQGR